MQAKYMKIYYDILQKIEHKEYQPLSKLPAEGAMIEEYQVSRDTVRKALALLLQNGYIQKSRGKAPIVLDHKSLDFPVSTLTTFTELAEHSRLVYRTYVEKFKLVQNDPEVIKWLQVDETEKVFVLVRVREIDGERIIIDKDYIKQEYVPELTKEICEKSLYQYFENELNLKISFAKKEITVRPASDEDRRLLDMKDHNMVVIVRSSVYLEDATLFQYTESRHRPDKFIFTDFARRLPPT